MYTLRPYAASDGSLPPEFLGLVEKTKGRRGECNTYRTYLFNPSPRNDVIDECRCLRPNQPAGWR